jgi:hypothetical protein
MQIFRTLLVNTVFVVVCAIVLDTAGVPVAEFINWGAAQVAAVVQQAELPAWVDVGRVEQVIEPVQAIVDYTVEWAAQLSTSEQ